MKPLRLDPDRCRAFQYVRIPADGVDLRRFPDFLIVGPQRTGTTWLHANLRYHPEIFLTEPKELFYFSRLKTPLHPRFESADLRWYLSRFKERPAWWLYKQACCLLRHRGLYRARVRGEATASYATLDRDVVEEIGALNPDLKVIFMVRDPIARAWSHAKKDLARNRGRRLGDVSLEEFERFFRDPYQLRCARYREQIETWGSVFPGDQMFVGFFEDIEGRPEELLRNVLDFLGVASDARFIPRTARRAVNPTIDADMPAAVRTMLEGILASECRSWEELRRTRTSQRSPGTC